MLKNYTIAAIIITFGTFNSLSVQRWMLKGKAIFRENFPVNKVKIYMVGGIDSASTNQSGLFSKEFLPQVKLVFKAKGFQTHKIRLNGEKEILVKMELLLMILKRRLRLN